MDTDVVHEPKLPGVRTYKEAIIENESLKKVSGVSFTVPQKPLEGMLAQGKGMQRTERPDGKQLFDVERAFNNEEVQEGTIVTDKRRSKSSVGGLLKSAFTEWWGQTQESVEKVVDKMEFLKPEEIPTVAAPEERTHTILEAAQHARQAPRDDHKVVIEKIRTFAHDAEVVIGKPFTVKAEKSTDTQTWIQEAEAKKAARAETRVIPPEGPTATHTLDLRSSNVTPDTIKRTAVSLSSYADDVEPKKTTFSKEALTVRIPEKTKPPTPVKKDTSWSLFEGAGKTRTNTQTRKEPNAFRPTPVPKVTLSEAAQKAGSLSREEIRERLTTKTAPALPQYEAPRETPSIPLPEVSVAPVQFEYEPSNAKTTGQPKFESARLRGTTGSRVPLSENRALKSALITGVIIFGSALGIFAAVSFKSPFPSSESKISESIPSFIRTDTQTAIPLGIERLAFFSTLSQINAQKGKGITQYYPVVGDGNSIATTDTIMEVLSLRAPGSFIRALSPGMVWGFSKNGDTDNPFIMLQSQNYDVMFAGMLEWEPFMSEDLAPLFGSPIGTTKSRTAEGKITVAHFSDALESNRSIRILYDETGKERMVYAFVSKSLLIITTDTETLARLIERVQ